MKATRSNEDWAWLQTCDHGYKIGLMRLDRLVKQSWLQKEMDKSG